VAIRSAGKLIWSDIWEISVKMIMPPRHAILFKTHFWDGFTRRQLDRLKSMTKASDIYVIVDETRGKVGPIEHDRVIRTNENQLVQLGFADAATDKSLFWYNTDYPLYAFFTDNENYDFYSMIEYDVKINRNIDEIVVNMADGGVDYLGFPLRTPFQDWPWFEMHVPLYGRDNIMVYLSCLAIFSNRAVRLLRDRRQEMTRQFNAHELAFWANSEAFIPTEINLAGFKLASLSDFGPTSAYDWWPPTYETDADDLGSEAFVHPVLEGDRYIRSILRHEPRLLSFFWRDSRLSRELSRFPRETYRQHLRYEIQRRLRDFARRQLERFGLTRKWTVGAEQRRPR
jgi:hypothetical protein